VLDGQHLGRPVELDVGRIHYAGTRWVGTLGDNVRAGADVRGPGTCRLLNGHRPMEAIVFDVTRDSYKPQESERSRGCRCPFGVHASRRST
jgi:hypothetical protein